MNWLLSQMRRLAELAPVRRLAALGPLRRVAFAMRATLVDERRQFALRELRGRRTTGRYRVRGTGVQVCLRHGSEDVWALDEVFSQRLYDPPAQVSAALQRDATALQIVDLGANIGLFGTHAIDRYPVARMIAFEPDPDNARLLACCVQANGAERTWERIEACAWTHDGTLEFVTGQGAISHVAAAGEPVATTSLPALDVFPHLRDVDLLKIDVEGGEWAIMEDERFASVPARALVLEYHPHLCSQPDPRRHAIGLLEGAGFSVAPIFHRERDAVGMLWAWREDQPAASARS
jgi:FkbM family methyltransferase